jgi:deoxyribodipyrimidine photo-lyase
MRWDCPLQVYHGLRHDYPWASDRFHTWILAGVIDLYAGFAARGINYAFWLDEGTESFTQWPAGNRHHATRGTPQAAHQSHLACLAERAALVVTDFFPTFIVRARCVPCAPM